MPPHTHHCYTLSQPGDTPLRPPHLENSKIPPKTKEGRPNSTHRLHSLHRPALRARRQPPADRHLSHAAPRHQPRVQHHVASHPNGVVQVALHLQSRTGGAIEFWTEGRLHRKTSLWLDGASTWPEHAAAVLRQLAHRQERIAGTHGRGVALTSARKEHCGSWRTAAPLPTSFSTSLEAPRSTMEHALGSCRGKAQAKCSARLCD